MESSPEPPPVLEPAVRAFADAYDGDPAASYGAAQGDPDVAEEWLALPGGDGERVRVRVLRPAGAEEPLPVILYLPGLAGARASATAHQRFLDDLVLGADAAVVVPDLDPSAAPFPAAVERAWTVARWVAEQGGDRGLDSCRIAVCGVSTGAALAAALALLAKERGGLVIRHQVLLCPVLDAGTDTPSHRRFAHGYGVGAQAVRGFWDGYLPGAGADTGTGSVPGTPVTASPARAAAGRLRFLPAALVLTAEADVARDEGEAYAARLRAAGVRVVSARYQGTIHGFVLFDALRDSAAGRAARVQTMDTLYVALHGGDL